MKRLYLMRHAKSDWDADCGSDDERPLNARGRRAARLMGTALTNLRQQPDLVITSSARRAHDTVELAAEAGGWTCPIEVTRDFYERGVDGVLRQVREQDGSVDRLLVAGHYPTWPELAGALVGGAALKFPTAAIARVDLAVDSWDQVGFGDGTLAWLITPKLLARAAAAVAD